MNKIQFHCKLSFQNTELIVKWDIAKNISPLIEWKVLQDGWRSKSKL